jgi:hypothetical protein
MPRVFKRDVFGLGFLQVLSGVSPVVQGDPQGCPRQVSLQRKISGTYLIFRLFARGRATSKHGGGGRYSAVLEFKGEYFFKKNEMMIEKKNLKAMYVTSKVKVSQGKNIYIINERKKERRKERKE